MKIAVYQGSFPLAAIKENSALMLKIAEQVAVENFDLLVFPECALTGYPPQDLLLQEDFRLELERALVELERAFPPTLHVILGSPYYQGDTLINALLYYHQGKINYIYAKQALPNYSVFDEKRYFSAGSSPGYLEIKGFKLGLLICEDLWAREVVQKLPTQLDVVISIHASPFEQGKRELRIQEAQKVVQHSNAPCIYLHQVSGQDELIFDGGSFVLGRVGQLVGVLPQFAPALGFLELTTEACRLDGAWQSRFSLSPIAELYQALVFSVREYLRKNHAKGVLLGLSGGVDSALVLAIAVDAVGSEHVQAVMMPTQFNLAMSLEDAKLEAEALGVKTHELPIENLWQNFLKEITPHFDTKTWDVTEENIQARLRGMILMALSNKSGSMVLSTSNKSEMAVGYSTLYGDMVGAFAPLKDIYKTEVYALARFRNAAHQVIPERVLTRAPSAELRPDQTDQDSLPDYAVLDAVLKLYLEENFGEAHIVAQGFAEGVVTQIINMLNKAEYKRQQACIGPKCSRRAFGRDWRMPVTKG